MVVLRESSFWIVSATAFAAHAVSRADLFMSIFGRNRIEKQRPFPAADSQRLPRWPRPAIWCSAKTTRPSFGFPFAICKIASFVELVSPRTIISRPITTPLRSACSSLATKRSRSSSGDMRHFQGNINCARRVGEGADGDVIDPSGRNAANVFQSNGAACFKFDLIFSQRDSLPNLSRRHVIEQDYVYTPNFNEATNLFQIVSLHFDANAGSLLAKLANPIGETGKSLKNRQMVIFHEHHVVSTKSVIRAATGNHRGFFQSPQPGSCFPCIQNFDRVISDRLDKLARQRCDAAQTLQKIQRDTFRL